MTDTTELTSKISALIAEAGLADDEKKSLLKTIVAENWPPLPSYSTLNAPIIEEVQKATVGTGVVMTFKDRGVQKAVLMKAGTHYKSPRYEADASKPTFMIPGGFIDLTQTIGTQQTPANPAKAEDPRVGAVRETEEELIDDKGNPILNIDPNRLKPMDTKTLTFSWGERRVVIGFMLELTADEAQKVKEHVAKLENDTEYRHAVRAHTVNPETAAPEICTVSILPLKEITEGAHTLLYPDQKSLFEKISQHLSGADISRK